MTLRFSASQQPSRCMELRPDGRWTRLLTALAAGPLSPDQLLEATDPGRYPVWRERKKIIAALHDMRDLGWIAGGRDRWIRTASGAAALRSVSDAHAVRIRPATPRSA